jgi:hypothetical protein
MSAPEPRSFEPKTPVSLNPPKEDPISVEELATADGKLSSLSLSCWLVTAAIIVSFLYGLLHRLASQLVVIRVCPLLLHLRPTDRRNAHRIRSSQGLGCHQGESTIRPHRTCADKADWIVANRASSSMFPATRAISPADPTMVRGARVLVPSSQHPSRTRLRCSRSNSVCRQGRIPRVCEILGEE